MHIAKREQYHRSIRRQQLDSILRQKRIKLLEQDSQEQNQAMEYEDIDLVQTARKCQTNEGIQHVFNLNIQNKLYKYFTADYLHTQQQDLVSSIFCNLYIISRPQQPSEAFTADLMLLLEKGSQKVISNCVTIVFNIAYDHKKWKEALVSQYQVCSIFSRQLQKQGITRDHIVNVLRTMVMLVEKAKPHDSFRLFFPLLVNFLGNVLLNDNWIISHSYFCFYHLSLMFNQEACNLILQHQLLPQFLRLASLLGENKFTSITLRIIHYFILYIQDELLMKKVVPFVEGVMRGGYKRGDKQLKSIVYTIISKLILEGKITCRELMRLPMGQLLMQNFAEEEDAQILRQLVEVFSIVIMNLDLSPLTEQLLRLFERVERILPSELVTIGFIKETQWKAKQRAMLMF